MSFSSTVSTWKRFSLAQRKQILAAHEDMEAAHQNQFRSNGTKFSSHLEETAKILEEWGADSETIIAGLLHDTLEDTDLTPKEIEKKYGKTVFALVEGVTKFTEADFEGKGSLDRKIETLRKLLEVMRKDIRVVIIKLADRLHNVRTMDGLPKNRRQRFARETLDVYHKLAYHLGINLARREFAHHCVPYAYPELAEKLNDLRKRQQPAMEKLSKQIHKELKRELPSGAIERWELLEHARSSFRDFREESHHIGNAYYLLYITKNTDACYEVLQALHSLYRPVSGKFHDYIAAVTENGYQSLHTAVVGPDGQMIRVRIRTEEMDEQVKKGILLHCFGEDKDSHPGFSWLRRSETLDKKTREDSDAFWTALQTDIFKEMIAVTVEGHSFTMPKGTTVLDALYTHFGKKANKVRAILLNEREVGLGEMITKDAVIRTKFAREDQVNFSWLDSVSTRFARALITEALQERGRAEKMKLGEQVLQRELDYFSKGIIGELSRSQKDATAAHFDRKSFDDVIVMIGEGVIHPRDVAFFLYPQRKRRSLFRRKAKRAYRFRMKITGKLIGTQDHIAELFSLARIHKTTIKKTRTKFNAHDDSVDLYISGSSKSRADYADFLDGIARHDWISHVQTMISGLQKFFLASAFGLAFLVIAIDVFLLPYWQTFGIPVLLLQILGLLPIFVVNYYLLLLLRHYLVRMRSDRWFLGLGFVLNVIALLVILRHFAFHPGPVQIELLPLLVVFMIFMLSLGFKFFQTESLLRADLGTRPLTKKQWQKLKRKKALGYAIRLAAVSVWGIFPLYNKYTPTSTIDPFVRLFWMSIGSLLAMGVLLFFWKLFFSRWRIPFRIPINILLFNITIGEVFFLFFLGSSLIHTTSTNFLLFQNFAPVLALLVGAILWRQSIPYLKDPRHMVWIFLVFLMGSLGSSLIVYNTVRTSGVDTLYGDILGLLAMPFVMLQVISQIRYVKHCPTVNGIAINLHIFSVCALLILPVLGILYLVGSPAVTTLTREPVLWTIGAGALLGIGLVFNYEAFKRIDGFIAFLMFNISILITFVTEVFYLHTFSPTWALLVGGAIIISSTICAELINGHCQRRGL